MKLESFLSVLFAAVFLSACQETAADAGQPASQEVQNFKDGEANAQNSFDKAGVKTADVQLILLYEDNFVKEGAFPNQKTYFCMGAHYQNEEMFGSWCKDYLGAHTLEDVSECYLDLAKVINQMAWSGLHDYWKKSGMTYDELAKLTGRSPDDIQTLLENEPKGVDKS